MLTELGIANGCPGLEQGLELPGLGPPPVVGDVGLHGAHQCTLFTLGA